MSTSSMHRSGLVIAAAGLVAIMLPSANARGLQPSATARELPNCIMRAAGGRTWLAGTLWALSDQEGGWVGAKVLNRNGSYDLGPLQINSRWVPRLAAATGKTKAEIAWWLQHDACFNIEAARWIFLSALVVSRDYWKAVGAYHSPNVGRQRAYSLAVANRLRRRFGTGIFSGREQSGPAASPMSDPRPQAVAHEQLVDLDTAALSARHVLGTKSALK